MQVSNPAPSPKINLTMRPLEFPEPLTESEHQEYLRQAAQLDDPRWHDSGKCGETLLDRSESRRVRHARFHRWYCPVHEVLVDRSGYEIGYTLGTNSRELNPSRQYDASLAE